MKNMVNVFAKEIHLYGFLVFTLLEDHADEFYAEVPARIAKGEFKYIEDIKKGLKWAGHAIYEGQAGKNHGKSIIEVASIRCGGKL